jgi:hypothetical protein
MADPDIKPFFAVREIKAMERCKNRNSILGKWKRVLEGDIKA